ncbi:hypothetical protein GCM10023353_13650 [Tomitella cavernea]|uniref:Uncharacterized protein n=1 Tax=Tomitella cavernea TaxID=1387982 RepID=A0ABP9CGA0_9ACTN
MQEHGNSFKRHARAMVLGGVSSCISRIAFRTPGLGSRLQDHPEGDIKWDARNRCGGGLAGRHDTARCDAARGDAASGAASHARGADRGTARPRRVARRR